MINNAADVSRYDALETAGPPSLWRLLSLAGQPGTLQIGAFLEFFWGWCDFRIAACEIPRTGRGASRATSPGPWCARGAGSGSGRNFRTRCAAALGPPVRPRPA